MWYLQENLNVPISGTITNVPDPLPDLLNAHFTFPSLSNTMNYPWSAAIFNSILSNVKLAPDTTTKIASNQRQLPVRVFLDRVGQFTNEEDNTPTSNLDYQYPVLEKVGRILKPGHTTKWFFPFSEKTMVPATPTDFKDYLKGDYSLLSYLTNKSHGLQTQNFKTNILVYTDYTANINNTKEFDPETGVPLSDSIQQPNPYIQLKIKVSIWATGKNKYAALDLNA